MHAVARSGPIPGLVLVLLAPLHCWAATAVVGAAGSPTADSMRPLVVGGPAPDIHLPSLYAGGEPVRVAEHRGKVVCLDFWSAWCASCRRAMPGLDALRREFSGDDFEVVGVNVDLLAEDARGVLERAPVSYPMALDTGGDTARRLGVSTLPALFLIDRTGRVREAVHGAAVEARDDLRATISELVEEGGVQ